MKLAIVTVDVYINNCLCYLKSVCDQAGACHEAVLVDSVESVDTMVPELGHLAAGDMNQSVSS